MVKVKADGAVHEGAEKLFKFTLVIEIPHCHRLWSAVRNRYRKGSVKAANFLRAGGDVYIQYQVIAFNCFLLLICKRSLSNLL
ncbi:hypothetical protein SDC9_208827 [bioreactor metagenome]|uniref:Uncharacterized protein n=1 Tax=bioreactor metagenome TaxID=1076179 RepID=A0A645JNB3_9ZZZZ